MSRSICNDTVVLELKLKRDEAGTVTLSEEIFHPCRVIHSFLGKGFVVVPTDYDAVPSVRSQLAAAEERILAILNTER